MMVDLIESVLVQSLQAGVTFTCLFDKIISIFPKMLWNVTIPNVAVAQQVRCHQLTCLVKFTDGWRVQMAGG